ncbi:MULTISPECIES: hypothetical protein [Virgibacillus]|uniref:hypothetical protein n=1 Tax=Virgibacillus TaxID=84406 RepID=UPI00090CA6CE|nr:MULTISPECIES: hypothetical protein [Virgibacillus]API93670.1 hypothetical protein BKP57_18735 [Virgibacillus sp. 6R]MBS7429930.1 hypothetical protein [Virgibacillus sp. 19R1-5]MBU8564972.1 hypothetical protein [Virgibacillus pantothenticus]MBU8599280.1 hypothetical protein [Virgibacillus pantothenticus]MBU8633317.1 hypothetical protein [Virgibacillus pantothenticus]
MDYTARIQKLQSLKNAIVSKAIHSVNDVIGFNESIDSWKGGSSQEGYYKVVNETKRLVDDIHATKDEVLTAISKRIASLEANIETQYHANKHILTANYDEDESENRSKKRRIINEKNLDSTVKSRLLARI